MAEAIDRARQSARRSIPLAALLPALVACATQLPATRALVLEDAERFAAVYSQNGGLPDADALRQGYLGPGSPGVVLFTPHRIRDADHLARAVARDRDAYRRAIERCLPAARAMSEDVEASIAHIGRLLGLRDVAPVFVLFGAGNSGGTAGPEGVALGLEVVCRDIASPAEALARLRGFVLHELTHVHKARAKASAVRDTLLRQILVEGFADFVMEMATEGRESADPARERHGRQYEAALWRQIQSDLQEEVRRSEWLYRVAEGRPADMGYWIGQRICEAYFARAADKPAAMRALLELRDPGQILRDSGYAPGV